MRAERPGGKGRGLVAALASALVHAGVVALVIWLAPGVPPAGRPVVIELVPTEPDASAPSPRPSPPAGERGRAPRATTTTSSSLLPATPTPTSTSTSTSTAAARSASPSPPGPEPEPGPGPGPHSWFSTQGLGPSPDLAPGPAPRGAHLTSNGSPLTPLGQRLAASYAPGWDLIAAIGATLLPERFIGAEDAGYLGAAKRYATTGNPFAGIPGAPGEADDVVSATSREATAGHAIGEQAEGLMAVQSGLIRRGAPPTPPRRLTTVVAVVQDRAGAVTGAAVETTSGSAVHDRLAVAQAERLVGAVLPGPPGGGTSAWAFESDLARLPGWVFGCALDARLVHGECPASLARLTAASVTLLAVRPAAPAP